MNVRTISGCFALLALSSLLLLAQTQTGLPWYPFWDGKQTRMASGPGLRKQLGVLDGAPGPQGVQGVAGPTGPQGPAGPQGSGLATIPCISPDGAEHTMVRLQTGQCLAAEVIVVGGSPDVAAAEAIKPANLAELQEPCGFGWIRIVRDASFATGGLPFYLCDENSRWRQLSYQADGTGFLEVRCDSPGVCLVGPNTAVVPSLPGPNAWTGANDFSKASAVRF